MIEFEFWETINVGDEVKFIGCDGYYYTGIVKGDFQLNTFISINPINTKEFWAGRKLVSIKKNKEQPTCSINKGKGSIMSNILDFVKNSVLSKEEKLLRKFNLKDMCGEFTTTARELVLQKLVSDNVDYLVEQATALEAEENKKNK